MSKGASSELQPGLEVRQRALRGAQIHRAREFVERRIRIISVRRSRIEEIELYEAES